jgi:histidine triad (HIT) family protein
VSDCLFCRLAAGEVPARLVHEDERVLAFHDVNPQAPVHVLVIPREHVENAHELEDGELLARVFQVARKVADEQGISDGGYRLVFNVGDDAGQSVPHAHLHVMGGRRMTWPPG